MIPEGERTGITSPRLRCLPENTPGSSSRLSAVYSPRPATTSVEIPDSSSSIRRCSLESFAGEQSVAWAFPRPMPLTVHSQSGLPDQAQWLPDHQHGGSMSYSPPHGTFSCPPGRIRLGLLFTVLGVPT